MKYTLHIVSVLAILVATVAAARWLSGGDGNLTIAIWLLEIALLTVYGMFTTYRPRRPLE